MLIKNYLIRCDDMNCSNIIKGDTLKIENGFSVLCKIHAKESKEDIQEYSRESYIEEQENAMEDKIISDYNDEDVEIEVEVDVE